MADESSNQTSGTLRYSPRGAHVLGTMGIRRNPDSSTKSGWAPNRATILLPGANPPRPTSEWPPRSVRRAAAQASGGSIPAWPLTVRCGRGDTAPAIPGQSLRQSVSWSRSPSGTRSQRPPSGAGTEGPRGFAP